MKYSEGRDQIRSRSSKDSLTLRWKRSIARWMLVIAVMWFKGEGEIHVRFGLTACWRNALSWRFNFYRFLSISLNLCLDLSHTGPSKARCVVCELRHKLGNRVLYSTADRTHARWKLLVFGSIQADCSGDPQAFCPVAFKRLDAFNMVPISATKMMT